MFRSRIIVIADNHEQRNRISSIINPLHTEILELTGSKTDSAILRTARPDLIIAVISISTEKDLHWCESLKTNPAYHTIPLILIGSVDGAEDIAQGLATNAFTYLCIDEVEESLVSAIQTLVSKTHIDRPQVKILVVDDSPSVRLMLEEELTKANYNVFTAVNGQNAMEFLEKTTPDIILSDVYMPEMNGIDLCRTLHTDPRYTAIPFVVMSTENDAGNMKEMMRYGAAAFIIKPFNIEQLLMTINKIFSYEFQLILIEKERLNSEQRLLLAGITSLVNGLEARDRYTRGHSERVAGILMHLVKMSGGTNYELERAQIAGKLHDIGKIGIRDNVLLKPDRLTKEEFDHIKTHPLIGAAIIEGIPSIADILPVISSHHERFDGAGYPLGLKGRDIPLWARMTAVADTYDALTSDRPYRRGMPPAKALSVISAAAGSQLCPDCVQLFFDGYQEMDLDTINTGNQQAHPMDSSPFCQ